MKSKMNIIGAKKPSSYNSYSALQQDVNNNTCKELNTHNTVKSNSGKSKCFICNKWIKKYVRRHLRSCVPQITRRCQVCRQYFGGQYLDVVQRLNSHMKVHNLQYKQCPICDLNFNRRKAMINHFSTHAKV